MSEMLNLSVSSRITGGPNMAISTELMLDAYDKINITVESKNQNPLEVEVQPANQNGRVLFLVIQSDRYGNELTYQIDDSDEDIPLDTPQIFVGQGSMSLVAATPPKLLKFQNAFDGENEGDATIQILVGRKAVV